ncbi:hypothetical protein SAMN05443287_103538 [Micromonospora phaseoli]|uniref:Lipoprotein LprG n=1 Tax=Micromonospora phaseoli TaxID=1144548 RepID=A0A1H6XM33_9ACTN|nr:hypothetical protein [Micromonospora phaseoli]PZW02162.1 hypothetical protein CLV64_102536 [Micromonospora phaseoli]GIJ75837.1 hypothetical protein Xph01_02690 [Micromonospora phaseoli]SEJ25890.1 hypothetical protein SAMN05443287_103538 [Micromonospora phaseoli]
MTQRSGTTATTRRLAATAVALLAATLGAGCDDKATPEAAPPPPDPKQELLAAVPDEQDPAFRFTISDTSGDVSGVIDPANQGMDIDTVTKDKDFTLEMSFRMVESRTWMKVNFKGAQDIQKLMKLPTKWMALDPTKVEGPDSLPSYEGTDPGNVEAIIRAATDVQAGEPGTYTGVVDLSAEPELADNLDGLVTLGDATAQLPLTAIVGADGNLSSLTLDIPAAGKRKASEYVVEYVDFGDAPQVVAFTDDAAQQAPAAAYDLLNG